MRESQKIINAGIGYTIGNILIKGISFLTIPLYTRLMSTSDYGIYNTYVAYVGIATFIVCLGLDPTVKNAEVDYPDRRNTYLSTVYCLTLIPFAAFLLIVLIAGRWVALAINMEENILLLLVLNAEAAAVVNIYNIKLSLSFSSKSYLKISFFETVAGVLLSLVLMLSFCNHRRYLGRIVGMLIPALIVAVAILFQTIIKLPAQLRFDRRMAAYALKLGLPLIPHLLSQIINSQFDRIMISTMVGYEQSGIYSFACNIAIIFQIVYQSLDTVWSPWFFRKMKQKDFDIITAASKKYITLIAFFAMGLMTISKEFVSLFSTKEYWEGISLAPILIAGFFFLFLYTLPAGIEYYTKHTKYIAFGSVVTAALNIFLNYIAIGRFGYKAAAYTTFVSYIVLFGMHWMISKKLLTRKLFDGIYIAVWAAVVLVWCAICINMQENWIVRYIVYGCITMGILSYFKNDILNYLKGDRK